MAGSVFGDSIVQVWWLAWTAFALPHGHDVFLAQWQNYPDGQNFGVNGSMLALGVLFMPITKVFGPVVSWNIALRLALAASAASMCFVLRRWVTWWPAAFVGGLIYGFSAYLLYFANGYLFLVFVPLPPVFFLLLHEILVRQKWRPSRVGVLLGVVCALQFFIWSEILASVVVVGVMATVLFLLVDRHRLQEMWRYAVKAFAFAAAVGVVLLLPAAAFSLYGPQNTHGSPTALASNHVLPSDLLGSIVPVSQWLGTNGLTAMAQSHFPTDVSEYVGLPMIVVLACFAILLRKPRTMLFAGAMALFTFVLSLGSRLWIDGHETWVPLPGAVFAHLPVLNGFTPKRFSLLTSLFVAAMFAIGLDELRRRLRAARRPSFLSTRRRTLAASGISVAIAAAVLLPLVPAHAQSTQATNIPPFFTSSAVDAIPEGSVVLSYPYPDISARLFYDPLFGIMLDQAASGMRFKLLGGYGWFPSPTGQGTASTALLSPGSVQEIFGAAYGNVPLERSLLARPNVTADLRSFIRKNDVGAVILQPQGADPIGAFRYVTDAIGCPAYSGDVAVWLHMKQRLAARVPGMNPDSCPRPPPEAPPVPLLPQNGSTVSGTTTLAAATKSGYTTVSSVAFYLSGGSVHDKLIGYGLSLFGWIAHWNTRTVPNGTYVLRSVAVDSTGSRSTSAGTVITVQN